MKRTCYAKDPLIRLCNYLHCESYITNFLRRKFIVLLETEILRNCVLCLRQIYKEQFFLICTEALPLKLRTSDFNFNLHIYTAIVSFCLRCFILEDSCAGHAYYSELPHSMCTRFMQYIERRRSPQRLLFK